MTGCRATANESLTRELTSAPARPDAAPDAAAPQGLRPDERKPGENRRAPQAFFADLHWASFHTKVADDLWIANDEGCEGMKMLDSDLFEKLRRNLLHPGTLDRSGQSHARADAPAPRKSISHFPTWMHVIHAMRHGRTEMNEFLARYPEDTPGWKDPMLCDTCLTPKGKEGARAAASKALSLHPKPEVLVVSPLTRALQTANLAFGAMDVPIVVEALARERVWHSADVGQSPQVLKQTWPAPRHSFDHLPEIWWSNGGSEDPKYVELESRENFSKRVKVFRKWLMDRPESVIAVVAHWGVLLELTGRDFENCELQSFKLLHNGMVEPVQNDVVVEPLQNGVVQPL
eukprot:gene15009-21077_t